MPTFSVIIPNYNYAAYLAQRIHSVIYQTFGDFELIILDDGSADNSREIIEQFRDHPKVSHIIYNTVNSGSAFSQWKKGIETARGDWIWIAESDDWSDMGYLQTAAVAIKQYPETGIFYCDSNIADENGQQHLPGKFSEIKNIFFATAKWGSEYHKSGMEELNEHLKLACIINNANSAVMRRDLLLPLLNEVAEFKYHGDWYCYIKLAISSPVVYAARALSTVRIHAKSLINKK